MARILIIEDEPDIVLGLEEDLRRQGHETVHAGDGAEGLARGRDGVWDLILLDVMLPKLDGFDVCSALRKAGVTTPIIMLTARAQEADKEIGLDAGADDYVTKPFSLRELRARIRAHLRRDARGTEHVLRFGDCEVDFARAEVRRSGQRVDVTPQELRLLQVFARHRGRLLTRDQLIALAWGHGVAVTDRVVDTHIFNLRKKVEPSPSAPRHLLAVRGLGYRFEDES